ncbi:bifunctional diaminohydroxyphosphoribosylaminopyrimidine deaminase/5-amino-6-(5-phosphoribosylamino)uracil reductase [soil metagenome]
MDQIFPVSTPALSDDDLVSLYSPADRSHPLLRVNFISSLDGSATFAGLSGELGGPADKQVFSILRRLSDVIVVGAGTIRAEGYGDIRLGRASVAWRTAAGLPPQPTLAIVSGRLDLDPSSALFANASVRPIVLTCSSADADRRARLAEVADVIECGTTTVEPARLIAALTDRGLAQMLCEGGPSLFGDLVRADAVDELCLTIAPALEGGEGARISHGAASPELRGMTLDHVLVGDGLVDNSMMVTKYSRARG